MTSGVGPPFFFFEFVYSHFLRLLIIRLRNLGIIVMMLRT